MKLKDSFSAVRVCVAIFCLILIAGCVISPRRTLGGGGGTPTPTPSPTPTPNPTATGKLYVSNSAANSILRFDNAFTTGGNIAPAAMISGVNTTLNGPVFITLDAIADRLYVANNGDLSILIFDNISTKNGNIAPNRTIVGGSTTLVTPTDVALDRGRDMLYVADAIDIHVFNSASTATANVAPARNITPGFAVSTIFIDAANDRLYVADQAANAVHIYDGASTLNGAASANRTVQGAATHLANPGALQVDGAGRLVVSNASPASITAYANAAIANGNIAPVAEISGSNTGFSVPDQIAVNPSGTGTLYNADPGAARIAIFTNLTTTASGNITPTRSINGTATTLTTGGQPVGVALDNTR
jgi:6-phosphogluconolactonase (cycloisomerase 2 family)